MIGTKEWADEIVGVLFVFVPGSREGLIDLTADPEEVAFELMGAYEQGRIAGLREGVERLKIMSCMCAHKLREMADKLEAER